MLPPHFSCSTCVRDVDCAVMRKMFLAGLLLLAWSAGASAAEEKGWFGFKLDVQTSGFALNPTVKTAKVDSVTPNSPAAEQKIAPGDEIIEAEGQKVPGGRALKLRPIMKKKPGESIRLRLKRANGETYSATIVAAKRPG